MVAVEHDNQIGAEFEEKTVGWSQSSAPGNIYRKEVAYNKLVILRLHLWNEYSIVEHVEFLKVPVSKNCRTKIVSEIFIFWSNIQWTGCLMMTEFQFVLCCMLLGIWIQVHIVELAHWCARCWYWLNFWIGKLNR